MNKKAKLQMEKTKLRIALFNYMQNVLGFRVLKDNEVKVGQEFSDLFEVIVLEIKDKEAKND